MQTKTKAFLGLGIFAVLAVLALSLFAIPVAADYLEPTGGDDIVSENFKFVKNIMIWFMLMLVAFLMIFIKKFEWGVALAVLLSAAGSFVVYLAIQDFYFGSAWNQDLLLSAVICAITVVIAIGCFLGTVKMWQYLLVGILFAPVYALIEWCIGGGVVSSTDPGGSILVHMCAAYFGLGVAIGIREKRAFKEPMYTSTHSVSFVWLASMLLWVLWPAFVTALLPQESVMQGIMTCYLAGIGSILSAWVVCQALQKKVNPLIYTYAMLAGPVAIGAPLLILGPWAAIVLGIVAGAISAVSFIYLQPWLCGKIKTLDVMGVHNLHGIAGWIGVVSSIIAILYYDLGGASDNIIAALLVVGVTLVTGGIIGFVLKLTRGDMTEEDLFSDEVAFIRNDEPVEL